jgi:hypothetical protein
MKQLLSTDRQQGIFNSIMKQSRNDKVFDCRPLIIEFITIQCVLPVISDYFIWTSVLSLKYSNTLMLRTGKNSILS